MFKYLIATCPINGQELTTSDWWTVQSRHKDFDCAEDELIKVSKNKRIEDVYQIFHLSGYHVGEQFNIRTVRERENKKRKK